MKAVQLSAPEQNLFAETAITLRYDTEEKSAPVTAAQVLQPRRDGDGGNGLWEVFNRTQEALVRGGVDGTAARGRRAKTRGVTGIDENTKINRALWALAEGMKALKTA